MAKRVMMVAGVVLALAAGAAALVLSGVRPPPSAAAREEAQALYDQAQSASEAGDRAGALTALDQAIGLDARADALRLRASLRIGARDFDGAQRDLDRAIGQGDPFPEDYSQRCWLRARAGDFTRARADCDRAIEIEPLLASAFGNRGLVGLKQNRAREAWADFNTALRLGGSDQFVAWRVFGRGVASWSQRQTMAAREDVDKALASNPSVAAEFAQFGLGIEMMAAFEADAFRTATNPARLLPLRAFLAMHPHGAHAADAQAAIAEIYAKIAADERAGRAALPGYAFAHARGAGGPDADSFGAIAISRASWRVAFSTDYLSPEAAARAASAACGGCEAHVFRNVCAALAISPPDRVLGLAWAHNQDDAAVVAVDDCRHRSGRACALVHSQCTPTPAAETAAP